MSFVDKVKIAVKAGRGGNGLVSFRREKYEDRGGPNGGDGGNGGDVVFVADRNSSNLAKFRYNPRLEAESGGSGGPRDRHGKSGSKLVVEVPLGTQIYNEDEMIADLITDGQSAAVAMGGKGGFGNAHFTSSTRQSPRVAENGEPGDELEIVLELKMLADAGLVGLPNAGKSTLLSVISNAKPEIADYPFTTLAPHLGVVDAQAGTMLVADIPGLIEGASEGKGLGDDFLRHVERTAVLVHLIDSYSNHPLEDYDTIVGELASYKVDLTKRPMIVALTKIDGQDQEYLEDLLGRLAKHSKKEIFAISAHSKKGLDSLLNAVHKEVQVYRERVVDAEEDEEFSEYRLIEQLPDADDWTVEKVEGVWVVKGRKIERFALRTDPENEWGINRLRDIMKKMGIIRKLNSFGAEPGDRVEVGTIKFEL